MQKGVRSFISMINRLMSYVRSKNRVASVSIPLHSQCVGYVHLAYYYTCMHSDTIDFVEMKYTIAKLRPRHRTLKSGKSYVQKVAKATYVGS